MRIGTCLALLALGIGAASCSGTTTTVGDPSAGAGGEPSAGGAGSGGAPAEGRAGGSAQRACGARAGNTCEVTEYCAYVAGQLCGAADAQAVCKARPWVCPQYYVPVCGCDQITYGNECNAAVQGTGVYMSGACAKQ